MGKLRTIRRTNKIVSIISLLDIFKPNHFDKMFLRNDIINMKSDWDKVGEDLKWGIKARKLQ